MANNLFFKGISPNQAMLLVRSLWGVLAVVWLVLAFANKSSKRTETPLERLLHLAPLFVAMWFLFGRVQPFPWLFLPLLPAGPVLRCAVVLLAGLGMAISIWARLSLGTNWSGMVTLKDNHELIRKGPYRRIRHPLYTGLPVDV